MNKSEAKRSPIPRHHRFRPLLELLEARLVFASDFGDAPLPYKTLLAEGGAEHVALGPTLGASRDTEADGVHSPAADGDDIAGIDDEDGVTFGEVRTGALGATAVVTVSGGSANLDAWIDFNGDGAWGGPGEQIADTVSVSPGDNTISFDVPSWSTDGTRVARFRLSTAGNLGVGGTAADGEIEDHTVTIQSPKAACGCFTPKDVNYAASAARSVYAADLDGDGDTDVLSASSGDDKIAWYENEGSGDFTSHIITTEADRAYSVHAADVDGDGDTDVLSASYNDSKIAWYENDGSASFTPHTITLDAQGARSVYATDVDGDGDTDVLSAEYEGAEIVWYKNDGNENFQYKRIASDYDLWSVSAADVDGDGDTDVLYAESSYQNKITWLENRGVFGFKKNTINTSSTQYVMSVYGADVDSDGDTDLLSASAGDDHIAWYENDGNENFTSRDISTVADGAKSVYATDVDGDGDTDVLSASFHDDKIAWYENDGNQNFTPHNISVTADYAQNVYTADLDGDGDIDVLSASLQGDNIAWYENDGSENFTDHSLTTAASDARSVYAADVDGDRDMDLLSASRADDKIAWYENDGSENFTSHTITTAANGADSVFAVDVDGDGDTDVLSASFYDDKIAWYENDGSENFTARTITTATNGAGEVFAADVDGDGDTDVLSASYFDNKIAWYENDGNQNFAGRTITTTAHGANSVYATDLDADGDLDVLSASYQLSNRKIAWYENDGSENFTAHDIAAYRAEDVYAADVDGDGDTDVLSVGSAPQVVWYENDGLENFTTRAIAGAEASSVYAADVDGDGDLDVLASSDYYDKIIWFENRYFVVVNTNDSGPGSLRQAIIDANAHPGADTISFAIGSGYQTIAPTSALPTITDTVIIDGTTQPGYAGAPLIEIWGLAAGPNVHGLVITYNSTVKGVVVNLFSGNGILITGSGNRIENSYIGTDFSGTVAVPNALNGIEIIGGSSNRIGGDEPGAGNIIAFNGGRGVLIDDGTSNAIRQNSIHSNDGLGIDLINGGNNNQAAPMVTRWASAGGTTKVWLTLTSTPNVTFSIDVFRNTVCDPSEFGEGEAIIGTAMLTAGADGTVSIIAVFGVGTPLNQFITATASTNATSEFSNCMPFRPKAPVTGDSAPPPPLPPPLPNGRSVTKVGVQPNNAPDAIITPPPIPPSPPIFNPERAAHRLNQPVVVMQSESPQISEVNPPRTARRIARLIDSPIVDSDLLEGAFPYL